MPYTYESPDRGNTIYRRVSDLHTGRELVKRAGSSIVAPEFPLTEYQTHPGYGYSDTIWNWRWWVDLFCYWTKGVRYDIRRRFQA